MIRAVFKRLISLIKLLFLKMFNSNSLNFHPITLLSLSTNINIVRGGKLNFQKGVGTRKFVDFSVNSKAEIYIGEKTFFNNYCMVIAHKSIHIGENCSFGPNVLIYDHDHDFKNKDGLKANEFVTSPIKIGNNVWIGANTIILRGTEIGNNSVVGAGSVLKGKYPSNSLIINKRNEEVVRNFNE